MPSYAGLRELRERMFRFRPGTVAHLARIEEARLEQIEAGDAPSVFELEALAEVYGLDSDVLWDEPIVVPSEDAAAALASQDEFHDLGDMTRARLVRAARAAKDLVSLRRLLDLAPAPLPSLAPVDRREQPYQQGASLAHALRVKLGLGVRPIESMRDVVLKLLPGVSVLAADLGSTGPAGLGFADATRGPAVVLNQRGKNENASVRRFSLAHELCHIFADWNRVEPLATISGYLSDSQLEREQRANGFAVRFLCPETVVHQLRTLRDEDALRVLMEDYKLHYRAARLYLRNEANVQLPEQGPSVLPEPGLDALEALPAVLGFPLDEVPFERRGRLAEFAARAWCQGKISRDAFSRYLGVTPAADVERVADFFDLELTPEALAG